MTESVNGVYSQKCMRFEWDAAKDRANRDKHGLTFEEASELFRSEAEVLEIYDQVHSIDEDRFIGIGPIAKGVIVVIYTEPDEDVIRIVSARFATRRERERYGAFERGEHE